MKTWIKVLIVTLVVGIPTVPLGRVLWPDPVDAMGMSMGPAPSGLQLGLLIVISLFEGLAFGLGVSFLAFGLPLVRRVVGDLKGLALASYLAIAWSLLSWWPHDNLHRITGDITGLIGIEYTFHVTLILSGAIIALTFLRLLARSGVLQGVVENDERAEPSKLGAAVGR